MEGYDAATFGDRIADFYDEWVAGFPFDAEATADFLAPLAGGGPALELGIGTGRIALPLIARGVQVHGVDSSESMVAKLRAKPGGAGIPVAMGDFADVPVEGSYHLVFVVFNTFFGLTTQHDQIRCFRNVAEHLSPGGAFVIEAFVPDLGRFDRGQRVEVRRIEADSVVLNVSIHDPEGQRVDGQGIVISGAGIRLYPVRIRYAWPSELDLMAGLAGLRLKERWAGWHREPFTASSQSHVSVYVRD
jgi:SAM-dependent methyltransferase